MNEMNPENTKKLMWQIREAAGKIGLDQIGFTPLTLSPSLIQDYEKWLHNGYSADMNYLKSQLELKKDPRSLLPEALCIISVGLLYHPAEQLPQDPLHGRISCYAYGRDYHKVLKRKLQLLSEEIRHLASEFKYRAFVDSGPVFEKLYAHSAGLGSRGKNSLLINYHLGSMFFIGELIANLPLSEEERRDFDPCHGCSRCVKSCPTGAILPGREINASRCIAYLTVEYRGIIPRELADLMGNHIFGCDDCQSCCPWNKRKIATGEKDFILRYTEEFTRLENLAVLSPEEFSRCFEGSPIRRAGYESFMRNVIIALGNSGDRNLTPLIEKFTRSTSTILRTQSIWALEKLSGGTTESSMTTTDTFLQDPT